MPDVYAPALLPTPRDSNQVSNVLDFVQDYNPGFVLFDQEKPKFGTPASVTYQTHPASGAGTVFGGFLTDWYYRIHFIPGELDIGNLLSNQSRNVVVWNAFFEDKTVSSFALSNGDGITVTEPFATPYVMNSLALYTYVVTLSTNGPPTIDATMTWVIAGDTYSVPVTGRRVVVWPFAPNWANPVDETLEWLTSIEASFDNTEQRFAMREDPRRVLEYRPQIVGKDTGLFESVVFGWADRLYALPLWQERAILTADAFAGATSLSFDTSNRTFMPDGLLVLLRDAFTLEALEIQSVSASGVVLKKPIETNWLKGSRVFPIMVSRLEKPLSAQYVAEDKIDGFVRFVGSPAETETRTPINAAPVTYNGVEVYTAPTNWINPMQLSYDASYDLLDSDTGVFSLRQRAGWPTITRSHEWLNKDKTVSTDVRNFFSRRRGRLTPAWIPTGTVDFKLAEDAGQTSSVIRVIDNDYGSLVNQHPARKHIVIQLRGGTNIIRGITGYTPDVDGTAVLALDATIGQNITIAGVRRISFIGLYRLASDSVTFSWRTDEVSIVQSNFLLTRPAA